MTVTPSVRVAAPGDEVRFTIGMSGAEGTNFFAFSFDVILPEGLTVKPGTGAVTSAFKESTGFTDADFQEEPRLNVAGGLTDAVYNGGPLEIATFACTVSTGGDKTVTLANIELLDEDVNGIPNTVIPATFVVKDKEVPASSSGASGGGTPSSGEDAAPKPPSATSGGSEDATPVPGDDSASVAMTPQTNPFADVRESDWFFEAVKYALDKGLMNGTAADRFSPNAAMTRAMLVTVLYRSAGGSSVAADNPFADVADGQWYTDAVLWAGANGIVNGVGGGRFAPDAAITRQDLVTILARHSEFESRQFRDDARYAAFADEDGIANYAKSAVQIFFNAGVVTGKPGNLFDPQGNATRAEVATVFERLVEEMQE
ncbi:MAG: S-layer homology domain-containing protein [Clostridiales Family XIII bacterium]|nr:S-layer homology domain-containing protein [Clostridiales Family XIII bacterium]